MIVVTCPVCQTPGNIREEFAGRTIACRQCRTTFTAPANPEPPSSPLADFEKAVYRAVKRASKTRILDIFIALWLYTISAAFVWIILFIIWAVRSR